MEERGRKEGPKEGRNRRKKQKESKEGREDGTG